MGARSDNGPTVLTYLGSFAQLTFVTLLYWLVGLLPEENHSKKGDAWARIGAYRWAAWHFRKYLKYSDDSFGRASLAWCYQNLGMLESAIQHYRIAYARSRRPDVGCCLAHAELEAGNGGAARALVADVAARRHELSPELVPVFADVEAQVSTGVAPPTDRRTDGVRELAEPAGEASEKPVKGRLLFALVNAYVTFATAFVVINALLILLGPRSTPAHLIYLFEVALVAGLVFCLGLLVVHTPVFGFMRTSAGDRLKGIDAGLLGAALVPGPVVIHLVIFHDLIRNPTSVVGWIAHWVRFPSQFLLWLLPFCVGGVVFALSFTSSRRTLPPFESGRALQPTSGTGAAD